MSLAIRPGLTGIALGPACSCLLLFFLSPSFSPDQQLYFGRLVYASCEGPPRGINFSQPATAPMTLWHLCPDSSLWWSVALLGVTFFLLQLLSLRYLALPPLEALLGAVPHGHPVGHCVLFSFV